ncbi:DUF6851 domain-containing protein [Saccharomonospora saliphila]|uniref:DUF6851 domain-containing protein n=1 Tax=Saccharomonospora saliphila TaxID=369829 RepID=UPI0003814845|nr:hypothetical protein [Saccharomonospora saliphila]
MAASEPSSRFVLQRRSLLAGAAAAATLLPLGNVGVATAAPSVRSSSGSTSEFDLDTGNFIQYLSKNADTSAVSEFIAPMDVTILIRYTCMAHNAWFDALAPYHPTAVGVYSDLGRRPASESETNRNKNIAALYSWRHVMESVVPAGMPTFRNLMNSFGLDPDDDSEDPTTPVGIGNLAGKAVVEARLRDGMNQLGDKGVRYHGKPYRDYTGYQPVNTAYELNDPSHWQPQLLEHGRRLGDGDGDMGMFMTQVFTTPQMRLVTPYTYKDPSGFSIPVPKHTDHTNEGLYKKVVDRVLAASAALTEEQKLKAEFFDNKFLGVGKSVLAAAETHDLDLDGWVQLLMVTGVALLDSLIACWHYKHEYNVVRPFSAIRHVYGTNTVTAWGGAGVGTVNDMPANEWASYLNVGNHPEYPSASTTVISAEAQAARRFLGSDVLDWTYTYSAGSSLVEPGITPANDYQLHWDTWTDFVQDSSSSRVWGGVHFAESAENSIGFGTQFGDRAHEFVQRHLDGNVSK